MDTELDLRPLAAAVVRAWRFLLGMALAGVIAAGILGLLLPVLPSATGSVLVIPSSAQLSFDPRFTTRDATQITNVAFQRQALIGLASSSTLEALTLAKLPPEVRTRYAMPGALLDAIDVQSEGDLLRVTAAGLTEVEARLVAETWAMTYQELVNETYSGGVVDADELQGQIDEAANRYEQTQNALVQFLGESRLVQIDAEIARLEGLLLSVDEGDRLLYNQMLSRTQELDLIISDAQRLREEVNLRTPDLNSAVAVLVLRARAASDGVLPITLQFDNQFGEDDPLTLNDLDIFIQSLQQQRDTLFDESQRIAAGIAENGSAGYALPVAQRTAYEQRLQMLKRDREQELGRRTLLEQRRAIALSSLEVLQRRWEEQAVARSAPQVTVRYLGVSIDSPPSLLRRIVVLGIVGLIFSLGLGLAIVLVRVLMRSHVAGSAVSGHDSVSKSERSVEQPVGD